MLRKLRKTLDYQALLDEDFYDDPWVIYINNHLYKDLNTTAQEHTMTDRSVFIIYPKDIEIIFGLSPGQAWRLLDEIRQALANVKKGPVTNLLFHMYTGIDKETIKDFMQQS